MNLKRLKYKLTIWSTHFPFLYYMLRRVTGRMNERCASPETNIVIEGFPRSANSSTAHAFIDRQSKQIKVAHHLHHVAQLIKGAQLDLPTVVLIREPRSAILSLKALNAEGINRDGFDENGEPFEDTIKAWLTFYEALEPYLDRVVIAPFGEATKSVETVITNVNEKFGTSFKVTLPEDHAARTLGYHAKPNTLRDSIKEKLAAKLTNLEQTNLTFRTDLSRATKLYEKYLGTHAARSAT
jgi:hypothetical protein